MYFLLDSKPLLPRLKNSINCVTIFLLLFNLCFLTWGVTVIVFFLWIRVALLALSSLLPLQPFLKHYVLMLGGLQVSLTNRWVVVAVVQNLQAFTECLVLLLVRIPYFLSVFVSLYSRNVWCHCFPKICWLSSRLFAWRHHILIAEPSWRRLLLLSAHFLK